MELMAPSDVTSVAEFLPAFTAQTEAWAEVFKTLTKEEQRLKGLLDGVIKIKKAFVGLQKLDAGSDEQGLLLSIQNLFRDVTLGMLDFTYPLEEKLAEEGFPDGESTFEAANQRLDLLTEWAYTLERLFREAKVAPAKETVASAESLGPEILDMLTKAAEKQKKKGTAKGADKENSQEVEIREMPPKDGDGSLGHLLHNEVWEALSWRRGSFRYKYISCRVRQAKEAAMEKERKEGDSAQAPPVLFSVLESSHKCFWYMLRAQGPVKSDNDKMEAWGRKRPSADDETATLIHHGIYSSTHLIALKQQAELSYWAWKYYPSPEHMQRAERHTSPCTSACDAMTLCP